MELDTLHITNLRQAARCLLGKLMKVVDFFSLLFVAITVSFLITASQSNAASLSYETVDLENAKTALVVSGTFDFDADLSQIRLLLARPDVVVVGFDSPGGNPYKAMELGRLIRLYRVGTVQFRNMECASACALAFFGGVTRVAEAGSIGVHKSSFQDKALISVENAVSAVQEQTADTIDYLVEMGVSPKLISLSLKYESDDIRYLSSSEMRQFNITNTLEESEVEPKPNVAVANPAVAAPKVSNTRPGIDLSIPSVKQARVRHPRGRVNLKTIANAKGVNVGAVDNGTAVQILYEENRWYKVSVGGMFGYMHNSWLHAPEYSATQFGDQRRFIQIKSVSDYSSARDYVMGSKLRTEAYLSSNGWFAITLQDRFERDKAIEVSKLLKTQGHIADDSYVSLGNHFVRKVCCEN